jgi:putative flippase GtrA
LRFAVIGTAAFLVDTAVLYLVRDAVGLYAGRVISFFVAVTFTWALNRRFTFPEVPGAPALRQWLQFVGANGIGAAVNYAVYAVLVTFVPFIAIHPVIAVGAGALSGLGFNFTASKRWVFRL